MDEKIKTQTFRFTNQFWVDGFEDEESLEASNNVFGKSNNNIIGPIESDEDSIEEEIETSQASIQAIGNRKHHYKDESVELLKNMHKPPKVPDRKSPLRITPV